MRKLALLFGVPLLMAVAGCGSDSAASDEPPPKGTAPPPVTTPTDMKSPEERGRASTGGEGS